MAAARPPPGRRMVELTLLFLSVTAVVSDPGYLRAASRRPQPRGDRDLAGWNQPQRRRQPDRRGPPGCQADCLQTGRTCQELDAAHGRVAGMCDKDGSIDLHLFCECWGCPCAVPRAARGRALGQQQQRPGPSPALPIALGVTASTSGGAGSGTGAGSGSGGGGGPGAHSPAAEDECAASKAQGGGGLFTKCKILGAPGFTAKTAFIIELVVGILSVLTWLFATVKSIMVNRRRSVIKQQLEALGSDSDVMTATLYRRQIKMYGMVGGPKPICEDPWQQRCSLEAMNNMKFGDPMGAPHKGRKMPFWLWLITIVLMVVSVAQPIFCMFVVDDDAAPVDQTANNTQANSTETNGTGAETNSTGGRARARYAGAARRVSATLFAAVKARLRLYQAAAGGADIPEGAVEAEDGTPDLGKYKPEPEFLCKADTLSIMLVLAVLNLIILIISAAVQSVPPDGCRSIHEDARPVDSTVLANQPKKADGLTTCECHGTGKVKSQLTGFFAVGFQTQPPGCKMFQPQQGCALLVHIDCHYAKVLYTGDKNPDHHEDTLPQITTCQTKASARPSCSQKEGMCTALDDYEQFNKQGGGKPVCTGEKGSDVCELWFSCGELDQTKFAKCYTQRCEPGDEPGGQSSPKCTSGQKWPEGRGAITHTELQRIKNREAKASGKGKHTELGKHPGLLVDTAAAVEASAIDNKRSAKDPSLTEAAMAKAQENQQTQDNTGGKEQPSDGLP